jgi:hypothetical protein
MWYEREVEYDTLVVDLKQVMMTPAIFRAVKRAGGKVKEKDYEKDPRPAPTPLKEDITKLDFFEGSPVKVKEHGDFYRIIDGRHRVAAMLLKNFRQISVEVISDN